MKPSLALDALCLFTRERLVARVTCRLPRVLVPTLFAHGAVLAVGFRVAALDASSLVLRAQGDGLDATPTVESAGESELADGTPHCIGFCVLTENKS